MPNLLDLNHVPAEKRVWYFRDLVDTLEDTSLIADHPTYTEEEFPQEYPTRPDWGKRKWHKKDTTTHAIREMVSRGVTSRKIAERILLDIKAGKFPRVLSSSHIVFDQIKIASLEHIKENNPPWFGRWPDVGRAHPEYALTEKEVRDRARSLDITFPPPIHSSKRGEGRPKPAKS